MRNHNPVGVAALFDHFFPKVARSSQPWAGGRCPFGAFMRDAGVGIPGESSLNLLTSSAMGRKAFPLSSSPNVALLLQCLIHKFEQRLRRRIVRQAEILVELAVVGFPRCEAFDRNGGVLQ